MEYGFEYIIIRSPYTPYSIYLRGPYTKTRIPEGRIQLSLRKTLGLHRDITPIMANQMENDMETLGPFKGVCRDITPIMENQMENKAENGMESGIAMGYIGVWYYIGESLSFTITQYGTLVS